ncbi:3-phosphoshikimate 1-carboxyvinyltransferase [Idiomarina sp. 29L]|uniref:3-phosphoshikimate 1-carboxyvinyltransferase n=1 Tax=Idiomarina sp. 29L TaxID=2508877 RepID=UPI001010E7A0|nr:3-phosphoshikimate 1-carboxyvinyltransferase [Idiomarina sp. 29L]RXS44484.1 3-phosphoshikimate 1-carboxyvinyltransferase [Idiomarina sp. 29L]
MAESIFLESRSQCSGTVVLPGSKSIANRALLMSALCSEPVRLHNLLNSEDTEHMLNALVALGVQCEKVDNTMVVTGLSGRWKPTETSLPLGNAGTAMRPLIAVLAATLNVNQQVELTGDARMQERPVQHLVEALQAQGAGVIYQKTSGFPPVLIKSGLNAGDFFIDGSVSSQFISALLMALPLLKGDSTLTLVGEVVSKPYIELTLKMLADFGVVIERASENCFHIEGRQSYMSPGDYHVEGDASGASYWMAAALLGGGPVTIEGVGAASIQGDKAFAEVIQAMGGNVDMGQHQITVTGSGHIKGIEQDFNAIPDAAMTVAPLALFADKPTIIRNVANWRVKETDRLSAMATELRKLGAEIEEGADYIKIHPVQHWQSAEIDTYKDHRMAMCFSLVAFSPVGITINDPDCCRKTYPTYFQEFSRICQSY